MDHAQTNFRQLEHGMSMSPLHANWIGVAEFTTGACSSAAARWLEDLAEHFGQVARRFETDDRENRAVIAPTAVVVASSVDSAAGDSFVDGLANDCPETVFLALSFTSRDSLTQLTLLTSNQSPAESVLVAVPEQLPLPEGLFGIAPLGLLTLTLKSGVKRRFLLYRAAIPQENDIPLAKPSGLKIGEAPGNLQSRSRWFQNREGDAK